MPIREEPWPHGTPSLISLAAPVPRTAAEPYANLLGWELQPLDGGLVLARVLDRPVAVVVPGAKPATWAQHLLVDDIYTAMATARVAGATMSDPLDLGGEGLMVRGTDPTGAPIGFWQPSRDDSAVGETGTLLWSELLVHDLGAATRFYDVAMDLVVVPPPADAPNPFTLLHTRDGELVGRIGAIDEVFADVPSHWMPYVQVEDVEDTLAMAGLFGAEPVLDPTPSDVGRIGIFRGRYGETVGVMELPAA